MCKSVVLITVSLFCLELTGLQSQTVEDIDGNIYKTVFLGTQVWMAENLKTTRYNDGTTIPLVTDDKAWIELSTSACCWYKNDATVGKKNYGAFYNWYTVNTKKLCPIGWHVPTDAEWTTLITYLGGEKVAGFKLKKTGKSHHNNRPNTGITNKDDFAALAGGCRFFNGFFFYRGTRGYWWCSTEFNTSDAWIRYMRVRFAIVGRDHYNKNGGFSVRCLKD